MKSYAYRSQVWLLVFLLSLIGGQVVLGETRLSYEDLLGYLTDLNRLPVIEQGVYCKQFSSYDRASRIDEATGQYINWDANGDAGQYIRVEPDTKEGVMAEMEGPGCIFRIWSANPQGKIRFYLDGDSKPTYEWEFVDLFRGELKPFIKPLVWTRDPKNAESASNCYLPIPFAKSCKVTSVVIGKDGKSHKPSHYYHIDYRTFPKDWHLDTFKLPLSEAQTKVVAETAQKWGGMREADFMVKQISIEPGQTVTAEEINGPAIITEFRAKLKSSEKWATRKVVLKVYWDGEKTPSIDCPIGDFFGEPKDVPYRSYPMEIATDMNSCFFPMPFHKSAKIVLVNEGKLPARVNFAVGHLKKEVPSNWGLFHAKYRQEKASTTFDYPLVEATGIGKFVGVCLFPDNIHGGWWGEGDEKVWVDGEKFPSWFGTGSEDYFGDAWGIRYFENPSHGHPQKTVERMEGCYRWHIGDSIPFYKSFKMAIENYAGQPSEKVKNDYYSVAYWYQLPGGSDFFKDTLIGERIPRGYVVPSAIEAENCVPQSNLPAGMTLVDDENLSQELSANRGVKLVGKVGDTFRFMVPANLDERYVVKLEMARGVKGSSYELLLDGQKLDKFAQLTKGPNEIGVRFTGEPVEGDRCELIVDYFNVDIYRSPITDWMIIGPFANPDGKGLDIEYPSEKAVDISAKYKGRDNKEVGWQKVRRADGIIQLNDLIQPQDWCVVYGACVVNAAKAGKRTMLLGSDDGVKVWINGKQVWEHKVRRAIMPDNDSVTVTLKQGPNLLLIKIEQAEGDLGWAVRFKDLKGTLSYELPK